MPGRGESDKDTLALKFLIVEMRVLGLMYYCNRHRLNWF